MSDVHTPEQRHKNMAAIHSSSTKPELKLRRALWSLGFRYRINEKDLPGKPDIVLPKFRTVVFVHGCFWHGHKGCKYYTVPKTNTEFWTAKIARNQERDQRNYQILHDNGWQVIVIWECQLAPKRIEETMLRVELLLNERFLALHQPKVIPYNVQETPISIAAEEENYEKR